MAAAKELATPLFFSPLPLPLLHAIVCYMVGGAYHSDADWRDWSHSVLHHRAVFLLLPLLWQLRGQQDSGHRGEHGLQDVHFHHHSASPPRCALVRPSRTKGM